MSRKTISKIIYELSSLSWNVVEYFEKYQDILFKIEVRDLELKEQISDNVNVMIVMKELIKKMENCSKEMSGNIIKRQNVLEKIVQKYIAIAVEIIKLTDSLNEILCENEYNNNELLFNRRSLMDRCFDIITIYNQNF